MPRRTERECLVKALAKWAAGGDFCHKFWIHGWSRRGLFGSRRGAVRRGVPLGMLGVLAMALGYAAESVPRASKPDVKAAIVATIEGQLVAFRQGDIAKAYSFAAAPWRAQKTMQEFALIVQAGYPEIWANTRAEFGIVREVGARAYVTVQVSSEMGRTSYDFTLAKEKTDWRILGVERHEQKKSGKA